MTKCIQLKFDKYNYILNLKENIDNIFICIMNNKLNFNYFYSSNKIDNILYDSEKKILKNAKNIKYIDINNIKQNMRIYYNVNISSKTFYNILFCIIFGYLLNEKYYAYIDYFLLGYNIKTINKIMKYVKINEYKLSKKIEEKIEKEATSVESSTFLHKKFILKYKYLEKKGILKKMFNEIDNNIKVINDYLDELPVKYKIYYDILKKDFPFNK